METDEFSIALADSFGNKLRFESLSELELFIGIEQERWQWVNDEGFALADLRGRFGPNYSNIQTWIQQFKNKEIADVNLRDNINSLYNPQRPALLLSDYAPGANVLLIRKNLNADQAGLALALLTGVVAPDFANLQHTRLWSMVALPTGTDPGVWLDVERDKLSKAREALRRELASHRDKIALQQDELTASNVRSRERYRKIVGLAIRIANRRAAKVGARANESIGEIKATEAAFTEQMKLKAPVGYWQGKRTKHRTAAICWGIAFTVYVIASACLGVYLFDQAWTQAGNGDGFTGKHFLLVAGIGTVLTLIFWISRVIMRIFLGELHLYTDAEERRVMTETYLALIKEGAATDQERALILAALFRSAQDGIVREDIGGEVGLAAIAAKMLEPKR